MGGVCGCLIDCLIGGFGMGGGWFDVSAFGCLFQGQLCAAPLDRPAWNDRFRPLFWKGPCATQNRKGLNRDTGQCSIGTIDLGRHSVSPRGCCRCLRSRTTGEKEGSDREGKGGSESWTPKRKPARPLQVSDERCT